MPDVHSKATRAFNMSRIRGKDTRPELRVRRFIHAAGLRYRLHSDGLPGKPDLVFPSRRTAVFVHGCFWHSHDCPKGRVKPATRPDFWEAKRGRTIERDKEVRATLESAGWRVLTIWECESGSDERLGELARLIASDEA